jgi:hypothetical protein
VLEPNQSRHWPAEFPFVDRVSHDPAGAPLGGSVVQSGAPLPAPPVDAPPIDAPPVDVLRPPVDEPPFGLPPVLDRPLDAAAPPAPDLPLPPEPASVSPMPPLAGDSSDPHATNHDAPVSNASEKTLIHPWSQLTAPGARCSPYPGVQTNKRRRLPLAVTTSRSKRICALRATFAEAPLSGWIAEAAP